MRRKTIFLSALITSCLVAAGAAGTTAIAAPAVSAGADLLASAQPVLPAPGGLDHFKCYTPNLADTGQLAQVPFPVGLRDQFGAIKVGVARQPDRLCNPVEKEHNGVVTDIANPQAHLVCHAVQLAPGSSFTPRTVRVANQFGMATLDVTKVLRLCLPSFKRKANDPPFPQPLPQQPAGLSHFLCYEARYTTATPPFAGLPATVRLTDQFEQVQAQVGAPVTLCNPVQKTLPNGQVTEVINPQAHLVCDRISQFPAHQPRRVDVKHQFGGFPLTTAFASELCVPSFKREIPTPTPTPTIVPTPTILPTPTIVPTPTLTIAPTPTLTIVPTPTLTIVPIPTLTTIPRPTTR